MSTKLALVRGLPGSGKSTYAFKNFFGWVQMEADDFRYVNQEYIYDRCVNTDAHMWCLYTTKFHLYKQYNVVVANTFCCAKHIAPYVKLAEDYNVELTIHETKGDYVSIHNVPESEMARLRAVWEPVPKEWEKYLVNNT